MRCWVLLGALAITACGPSPEDLCAAAAETPATIHIGTGAVVFEALEGGEDVKVVQGPQGGFHILGSFQGSGLHPGTWEDFTDPDNPMVSFSIREAGVSLGGFDSLPRPLKVRTDGTLELVGEYVVLEIGNMDEATFRTVTFGVEVKDTCGTTVEDSVEVFLVP